MQNLRRLIPSLSSLVVFEAAGRLGSFTIAGKELGMSQAAVSYAIKQLEDVLGVSLFARQHRRVELTSTGERFHRDVSMGLSYITQSAETLARAKRDRHVTLSVSTAFATYWMLPRLAAFREAHPDIDLRLQTTDRDVDLATERITLGVRRGFGDWQAYDCALIADERISAIASPAYLEQRGTPRSPTELRAHRLIHLEEPYRPTPDWRQWFASCDPAPFTDNGQGLRLNDYALVLQAVLEGQGVALGWDYLTERYMAGGLVERAVDHVFATDAGFYVVWPRGAVLHEDAEAVRDWMIAQGAVAKGSRSKRASAPARMRTV
ncbi:MAG: LysR family transcriptional regulator [Rhodobiaceae bacterium]|nr:LysR family transcriptional regulator [Rhodobiaceae bacterium]MCC0050382.1 LysR family transcriptional regulator [Rhodobiaceae bacterium]MCC0061121.1 LysR family transcriptional regulator [Rhodobiaceae bacterium]